MDVLRGRWRLIGQAPVSQRPWRVKDPRMSGAMSDGNCKALRFEDRYAVRRFGV